MSTRQALSFLTTQCSRRRVMQLIRVFGAKKRGEMDMQYIEGMGSGTKPVSSPTIR